MQAISHLWNCTSKAGNPDLKSYANLQAFFGRSLRDGARTVDASAALVSPADCKVLYFGDMSADGTIDQVGLHGIRCSENETIITGQGHFLQGE